MFYRFIVFLAMIFVRPFVSLKVLHKENLKYQGGAIIVANHLRAIDVIWVALLFRKENLVFLGKKEAFESKFGGWFLRKMGAIPIDREGNDVGAMLKVVRALKQGKKVCVFPEGTRNKKSTELLPTKNGACAMAIAAKVPLIPMIQYNRFHMFRRSYIAVGTPYDFSDYYASRMNGEKTELSGAYMRENLLSLQGELASVMGLPKKERKKRFKEKGVIPAEPVHAKIPLLTGEAAEIGKKNKPVSRQDATASASEAVTAGNLQGATPAGTPPVGAAPIETAPAGNEQLSSKQ